MVRRGDPTTRQPVLFVRADVSDISSSSRLAVHVLAQSPSCVRASVPASQVAEVCRLVARGYGVESRLDVRAPKAADPLPADAVPIDAENTTPASAWQRVAEMVGDVVDIEHNNAILSGRRLAVVQSIPIHYRVALFNAISRRLSSAGASLHVIFTSPVPSDRAWITPGAMEFAATFAHSIDVGRRKGRRLVPLRLDEHLRKIEPDIVLSPGFSPLVSGRIARWCERRNVRFGVWSGEIGSRSTAQGRLRRMQRRGIMEVADFAVAYGWESARYLDSLDSQVPVVVGRNTSILTDRSARRPQSSPVELLVVSRCERGKRLDLVVSAVLTLDQPNLRLTIVGDGPELRDLKKLVGSSKRVRFLGALRHGEVLREYANADVFLFPSEYDIFGLVLVEAMAEGLGVITSSSPGALPDIAIDGTNCVIVPDARAEAWLEAIRFIVDTPGLLSRMGSAASRAIRSRWTIEHAAESMLAGFRLGLMSHDTAIAR
jgi:glycosyltransferase involved in cell wall biosynthesis